MPDDDDAPPPPGRQARARANDQRILAAARAVFLEDPSAPISAVADRARVGISAVYRRYAGKEVLLQSLCLAGLQQYLATVAEARAYVEDDPWHACVVLVGELVDADVHSLTVRLAGTFATTEEVRATADRAGQESRELFDRITAAGVVRPDLELGDLTMILEQLAAVRVDDQQRTRHLRRRYVTLWLDAIRADPVATPLPGPGPTVAELSRRWRPD